MRHDHWQCRDMFKRALKLFPSNVAEIRVRVLIVVSFAIIISFFFLHYSIPDNINNNFFKSSDVIAGDIAIIQTKHLSLSHLSIR